MNRRRLLALGLSTLAPLALALSSCGLAERPYAERRQWPLAPRRAAAKPPRRGGRVLLVRALGAGPGMEARGLQSLRPDGSVRTEFYEEWAVPPAEAAEDALRRWLADCGQFAAVIGPSSRLAADIVLEGELTALWTVAATGMAHAGIGVTAIDQRGIEQPGGTPRIRLQRSIAADVFIAGADPAAAAAGMTAALGQVFAEVERALGR